MTTLRDIANHKTAPMHPIHQYPDAVKQWFLSMPLRDRASFTAKELLMDMFAEDVLVRWDSQAVSIARSNPNIALREFKLPSLDDALQKYLEHCTRTFQVPRPIDMDILERTRAEVNMANAAAHGGGPLQLLTEAGKSDRIQEWMREGDGIHDHPIAMTDDYLSHDDDDDSPLPPD